MDQFRFLAPRVDFLFIFPSVRWPMNRYNNFIFLELGGITRTEILSLFVLSLKQLNSK